LKYNVEFQHLATRTSWDKSALRHQYYAGLPDHIKDILVLQSKPKSLVELKTAAHSIDTRYWEHQREKSHSDKTTKSDRKPSSSTSATLTSSIQPPISSTPKLSSSFSFSKPKPSSSYTPKDSLSDKLRKDKKLTTQECKH